MTRKAVVVFGLAIGIGAIVVPTAAQTPVGSAFTYQGRLTDAGQPYTGMADLTFRLFDAETVGNQVGPDFVIAGHTITDGLLTADLDFGPGAFLGDERWLALEVNGVPLGPRQPVRPAPYALFAMNAPGGGGSLWQQAGSDVFFNSGRVGIGTASPLDILHVEQTATSGTAEALARFSVSDTSGNYLLIGNSSGSDTQFDSMVKSFQSGSAGSALTFEAETNQDGTSNPPAIVINAKSTLGSMTGRPLFGVNNNGSEVLRVTHDGKVGIGTATPSARLHVGGTPGADGIRFPDGTLQVTAATGGGGGSPWLPSGSDIYYSAGMVGIGTAAPTHRLTIRSTDDNALRLIGPDGLYAHGARINFGDENNVFVEEDEDDKLYVHARLRTAFMSGFVGIGTTDPQKRLSVSEGMNIDQNNTNDGTLVSSLTFGGGSGEGIASKRTPGEGQYGLDFYTNFQKQMSITQSGDLDIVGTARANALEVTREGSTMVEAGSTILGGNMRVRNASGGVDVEFGSGFLGDGALSVHDDDGSIGILLDGGALNKGGELMIHDASGTETVKIRGGNANTPGRVTTPILEITGGSDLSEQFDVTTASGEVEPGMVVCIDPNHPGKLLLSTEAYDHKVAGIISGAGGIKPGMLMGQSGTLADGDRPVALTGRVWTWCDASSGAIEPGDLLTTSGVLGHAMKVTDGSKAHGAVLGKAMTALESGHDLVLVLVSLQ